MATWIQTGLIVKAWIFKIEKRVNFNWTGRLGYYDLDVTITESLDFENRKMR